jgi:hypothetical protein
MSTVAGSVIKDCSSSGILSSDSGLNVVDCNISGNETGIKYSQGPDPDSTISIANSIIENSSEDGIEINCFLLSRSSEVSIHNNVIRSNNWDGIRIGPILAASFTAFIANNLIYGNSDYGISLGSWDIDFNAYVRNNTIADNNNGLEMYHSDSGDRQVFPEVYITNCILWGNHSPQIVRSDLCNLGRCYTFGVSYSCIEGGYAGGFNINTDPCFVNPENDNFHLDPNSRCIDIGNSSGIPDTETDIDGEDRIADDNSTAMVAVDMGADEFHRWNKADFNHDEIVNFLDYAILAKAWRTASGESDYDQTCDLQHDNLIDLNDLRLFCREWLHAAPWREPARSMMMGGEGMSETLVVTEEALLSEPLPEPPALQMTAAEIEQLLNWLTEIWLNDEEFRQVVDYDVLFQFMELPEEQTE